MLNPTILKKRKDKERHRQSLGKIHSITIGNIFKNHHLNQDIKQISRPF